MSYCSSEFPWDSKYQFGYWLIPPAGRQGDFVW